MLHPKPLPLETLVQDLQNDKPFSLVRHGDGEFKCIIGEDGETCDGQRYSPELGIELLHTLSVPRPYYYCIGPRAASGLTFDVEIFCRRRGIKVDWWDSETFLNAAVGGWLYPFVQELRKRRVLTVGPAYLKNHPAYQAVDFIEVPGRNAYDKKSQIWAEVMRKAYQSDVVCFSAGPVAKLLIYDLWPHWGQTHFLLDCGSLWDWMADHDSRSYSRKWDLETRERLKRMNLEGA